MSVSIESQEGATEKPKGLGVRHVQAFMTFLAVTLAYAMRTSLSIGIVAMTTDTGYNHNYPILPWSISQQGTILSSFFWGYIFLQVPTGNLSRRFGPKYFLFACVLGSSLLTLTVPFVALNFDWRVFCASRVLTGLVQGLLAPSCNQLTSKWAPPSERSRMFSFIFGGSVLGAMVMMLVAGYLAACSWGWPSIFYCVGGCGILWAVAWVFLGANGPESHPHISVAERDYIKSSLVDNAEDSSTLEVPWGKILRSVPLWALLAATLSENWGYWMLLTMIPNFMSHALNFDIKSNGVLSALPYLVMYILTIIFSWIADYIIAKRILSIEVSRKMWNTICHWGGAISLVSVSLVSTGQGAVILLTLAVGLNAAQFNGFLCNHLDIAPNFAGLLMGITNGCGVITSICGPLVTGLIVEDVSSKSQWMTAFYAAAVVFFVGNVIFLVFGTTKVQPWNDPSAKTEELPEGEIS